MKPPTKLIPLLAALFGLLAARQAAAYDGYGYEPRYDSGWESRHHHRSVRPSYYYDRTLAWAQSVLNSLGYYCGSVDGVMGPRTQQALVRYQCDHDLPHTGWLDHATISMLQEE